WFARIRVHVEAWKVAARNIQPNTMTAFEDERSRVHLDREFVWLTGRERFRDVERFAVARADDAVADIEIYAGGEIAIGRIHVDQLRREVGVGPIRRRPQLDDQTARNFDVAFERRRLKDDYIRSRRERQRVGALPKVGAAALILR